MCRRERFLVEISAGAPQQKVPPLLHSEVRVLLSKHRITGHRSQGLCANIARCSVRARRAVTIVISSNADL